MSTLGTRKDSPYWFISFDVPQPDGSKRRLKKSTKKKTQEEAMEVAPRIIEAERKMAMANDEQSRTNFEILAEASRSASRGELSEARTRELLSRMLKSSTGSGFENYTVRSWAEEWKKRKRPLKKATRSRYETSVRAFLDFLDVKADKSLDQITKAEIRGFRDEIYYGKQNDRPSVKKATKVEDPIPLRTAVTANHYTADIKSMLTDAVDDGLLWQNPMSGLEPLPENDSMKRQPFLIDEVKLLIAKAGDDGWYGLIFSKKAKTPRLRLERCLDWPGMILFGYYTGTRIRDVARLTWSNIELSSGIATFVPAKTKKQMPSYQVPLHPSLIKWLEIQYSKTGQRGPVFPSLYNSSTSGKCGLSSQFIAIMGYAKVDRILVRPASKGIRALYARSFHSIRHTSNSDLANADVSQELRMKIIGHQSKEVNKVYTHLEIETMRSAIKKLPSL